MKQTEQEFTDVINALALLKTTKPNAAFCARMKRKVRGATVTEKFAMPFFAAKIALVVFLVLLSGNNVISVASESTPGEALYPVKQLVDSVKMTFTSEQTISQTPSPQPQKHMQKKTPEAATQQQSPQPSETVKPQTVPASEATTQPTPTPVQQSVLPAVHNTVNHVLQTAAVLGSAPQPTPTPQPNIEGSKDNGSDAGAGGSLLPKINIKL